MSDRIAPQQFHAAEGVEDWRILPSQMVGTCFQTGDFAAGLALVDEIGRLADAADHHPDVDLRYGSVTVFLISHDIGGLSQRDVRLAQQISAAARDRGIAADPGAVQQIDITVDALDPAAVAPFWRALLAYDDKDTDPRGRGPSLWFVEMDEPRPQRNRIHLDLSVPHDQAEARIAAAMDAGGRIVTAEYAPAWWVLADPEGNEACVCTWMGRD